MTTDEKAKAYDEAINQAKKELQTCGSLNCDAARQLFRLFPQLKENEDDRIINQLISLVRSIAEVLLFPTSKEELITWLNKCKESLHISETCKKDADSFTDEDERIRKELVEKITNLACGCFISQEQKQRFIHYLEKQKEQKPVDKFQEYLNASPAERRKMNMDEILGDNKGHQKTPDALTTDSNKEADTSDCKYKNLDEIAQEYVDGVRQYNPEPTWDLMQTAVCYGYHLAENKQKPVEWGEEDNIGWDEAFACVTRAEKAAKNEEALQNAVTAKKWLKEIKFRYYFHPVKQEWGKEDEKMRQGCIDSVEYELLDNGKDDEVETDPRIAWLKSLRPQPKPEWSKEETKDLVHILKVLDDCYIYGKHDLSKTDYDNLTSTLKSLRPSWKPSEINPEEVRLLDTTISFLKDFADKGYENAVECIDWLKSKRNGTARK